jgi:hypothetical protein
MKESIKEIKKAEAEARQEQLSASQTLKTPPKKVTRTVAESIAAVGRVSAGLKKPKA